MFKHRYCSPMTLEICSSVSKNMEKFVALIPSNFSTGYVLPPKMTSQTRKNIHSSPNLGISQSPRREWMNKLCVVYMVKIVYLCMQHQHVDESYKDAELNE